MLMELYWWGAGGILVKILLGLLIIGLGWLCFFPDSLISAYSHFKYWLLDKIGKHPARGMKKKEPSGVSGRQV